MVKVGFREMVVRENFIAVYPSGWKNNWNDGRRALRIASRQEGVDVRIMQGDEDPLVPIDGGAINDQDRGGREPAHCVRGRGRFAREGGLFARQDGRNPSRSHHGPEEPQHGVDLPGSPRTAPRSRQPLRGTHLSYP